MDFERNKWTESTNNVKHIVVKEMHYASVDAVLLVNVSIFYVIENNTKRAIMKLCIIYLMYFRKASYVYQAVGTGVWQY